MGLNKGIERANTTKPFPAQLSSKYPLLPYTVVFSTTAPRQTSIKSVTVHAQDRSTSSVSIQPNWPPRITSPVFELSNNMVRPTSTPAHPDLFRSLCLIISKDPANSPSPTSKDPHPPDHLLPPEPEREELLLDLR